MLKALGQAPAWRDSPAAHTGAETLLALWAASRERHPYIFYMGADFRKLKVPFVWYDLLHVLDVLSQYPWLHPDPRLREMAGLLASKADAEGRFTLESVWQPWGVWEFGQKKAPSCWLTLLAHRILRRFPPDADVLSTGDQEMMINARYVHTNLIARDWRALRLLPGSARLRTRAAGARSVWPRSGSRHRYPRRTPAGRHLRLPGRGDDGPTLEIFTYGSLVERPATAVNRLGFGHIAFSVEDVADT